MVEKIIDLFSNFLRPILYIFIAMLNFMLANLYFEVNKRRKEKSKIIKKFVYYLASLTIFFMALSVVPIVRIFSIEDYLTITRHFYIFALPVFISGWLFWQSVAEEEKKGGEKL